MTFDSTATDCTTLDGDDDRRVIATVMGFTPRPVYAGIAKLPVQYGTAVSEGGRREAGVRLGVREVYQTAQRPPA